MSDPQAKKQMVIADFETHTGAVEREFRRVYAQFEGRMQCQRGCSMCCSQMFAISMIEGAYISRAVKGLPEEERENLRQAARVYIDEAKKLTGAAETDDNGVTPRPGLRLPCPALKDNACSIYSARPIICRKWGIPIFDPKKPMELQACELNFQPGEEIDIEGLLEPQVELLEDWIEIKERAREDFRNAAQRTTIAEAIVNDFEEALFSN